MRARWARWEDLHATLIGTVTSLGMELQFGHARVATSELRRFSTGANLLEFLASALEGNEEKNAVLAAMVRAVQWREPWAPMATTLLWCGLWPGLDGVYRRQLVHFHRDREELVSLISVTFTTLIAGVDLHSVRRVAATLVRNTERDVARARQRDLAIAARTGPLSRYTLNELAGQFHLGVIIAARTSGDIPAVHGGLPGISPELPTAVQAAAVLRWLHTVIGDDAELFLAIDILDEDPFEVADRLGVSHAAVRKRIQRIRTRLARSLSQTGPEIGISYLYGADPIHERPGEE